jgi:hypothetical protein
MASETTILELGPDDAGMRLTAEAFAHADFQEPYTYERVQGRLVLMSPAGPEPRFEFPPVSVVYSIYRTNDVSPVSLP